jgi:hypothetical protein
MVHAACTEEMKNSHKRQRLGILVCRWENNIKMCLKEKRCGLDSPGSEQGPAGSFSVHGNEPSDPYKVQIFLTSYYQLLKRDSTSWRLSLAFTCLI